jgi:hypothetical protein
LPSDVDHGTVLWDQFVNGGLQAEAPLYTEICAGIFRSVRPSPKIRIGIESGRGMRLGLCSRSDPSFFCLRFRVLHYLQTTPFTLVFLWFSWLENNGNNDDGLITEIRSCTVLPFDLVANWSMFFLNVEAMESSVKAVAISRTKYLEMDGSVSPVPVGLPVFDGCIILRGGGLKVRGASIYVQTYVVWCFESSELVSVPACHDIPIWEPCRVAGTETIQEHLNEGWRWQRGIDQPVSTHFLNGEGNAGSGNRFDGPLTRLRRERVGALRGTTADAGMHIIYDVDARVICWSEYVGPPAEKNISLSLRRLSLPSAWPVLLLDSLAYPGNFRWAHLWHRQRRMPEGWG